MEQEKREKVREQKREREAQETDNREQALQQRRMVKGDEVINDDEDNPEDIEDQLEDWWTALIRVVGNYFVDQNDDSQKCRSKLCPSVF
jgi:hypothetical protein